MSEDAVDSNLPMAFPIPREQRFFSCIAFGIYKVVRVAWLVCRVVGLFTPLQTRRQTNHANDFVKAVARENLYSQATFPRLQN